MSDAGPEFGLSPEVMAYLMAVGQLERSPVSEMVGAGSIEQVLPGIRARLGNIERMVVLEGRDEPNALYPAKLLEQEAAERVEALRFLYPLGLAAWPKKLLKEGYVENPDLRESLAKIEELAHKETKARIDLLEKLIEQIKWGGDIKNYLVEYFLSLGKKFLPSRDYWVILNSPETLEGFIPLGKKTEAAFRELVKIGRGEVSVTWKGKTKKLPNVFGMPPNQGLLLFAFENHVMPELAKLRNSDDKIPEGFDPQLYRGYENLDDFRAIILAYELFRHWDYDVFFAFGRKGGGEAFARENLTREEMLEASLRIDYGTKDSAKLFIPIRQALEFRGTTDKTKRREHPRPAGNPMTFGVAPILATNMLDIITTQVVITDDMKRQIIEQVGMQTGRPVREEDLKSRTIELSVHDYCFEKESNNIKVKVNDQEFYVALTHEQTSLADVLWDDVIPVNAETEDPWWEFAFGPQTNAFEVPGKLAGFYAYLGVFAEIMRVDFAQQFAEYTKGEKLRKLNKQLQQALVSLATGFHLRETTVDQWSNYLRVHLGGSLCAAKEYYGGDDDSIERGVQVNELSGEAMKESEAAPRLLEQMRLTAFLSLDKDGQIKEEQLNFFERVRKARKPILPGDSALFSIGALLELAPLYPLGLFSDEEAQVKFFTDPSVRQKYKAWRQVKQEPESIFKP